MAGSIPNPKVTMEFAMGSVGWQESHIYSANVPVDNPQLKKEMKVLASKRAICLGPNVRITLVKASQEQINRDVSYLERDQVPMPGATFYNQGPVFPGSDEWTFQSPHISWPVKLTDAFQNQLAISYIAGMPLPTKQIGPGPYDVAQGSGTTVGSYLEKYCNYLISGPWGVSSRGWPAGPFTVATSTVMSAVPLYVPATATTPPMIKFAIPQPVNGVLLVPGSFIRVGGLKYTSPQRVRLNGTWQVFNAGGGIITVLAPRVKVDPNFATIGYAQAAAYSFQQYTAYTLDDMTHKKRGRVVSSPAGRRPSR